MAGTGERGAVMELPRERVFCGMGCGGWGIVLFVVGGSCGAVDGIRS